MPFCSLFRDGTLPPQFKDSPPPSVHTGYGYSDKPNPRLAGPPSSLYNFDTWSDQLLDFTRAVIGRSAVLSCNSVGGLAGLQAAVKDPAIVRAVQVINISLRALHLSKQAAWKRPAVSTLQRALRTTGAGPWLFKRLATRDGVRRVLQTCYGDPKTVTDELVDYILKPGLEPGAVEVFLDFISYSSGPLPEDLLQVCVSGWRERGRGARACAVQGSQDELGMR